MIDAERARAAVAATSKHPFNSMQGAAIEAPLEPGVIIAGAGTGKTTVMAARVVWLIASGQVRPDQVLGLTFTRKAAASLLSKVNKALRLAGLADDADAVGEPTILTYDAFAGSVVTDHGLRLGVESDRQLITGAKRYRLASDLLTRRSEVPPEVSGTSPKALAEQVMSLENALSAHQADFAKAMRDAHEYIAELQSAPAKKNGTPYASLVKAEAVAEKRAALYSLAEAYHEAKKSAGLVEFTDQMTTAADVASAIADVSRELRSRFAVVLLDEYQDTSNAQAGLLRSLFSGDDASQGRGHPVTAVGDPFQAIYGWRGAAASNIEEFKTAFPRSDGSEALSFPLSTNFRSGQLILDCANSLMGFGQDSEDAPENAPVGNRLVSNDETKPCSVDLYAFESDLDEVTWIVDQIAARHETGIIKKLSDVAILCRTNDPLQAYYVEMRNRGIPVTLVGLGQLLAVPEISDIVSTLRILGKDDARADVLRLLSGPRWNVGPEDLAQLGRVARHLVDNQEGEPANLLDAMADSSPRGYTPEGRRRITDCYAMLENLRKQANIASPELVRRVVVELGLDVELGLRGEYGDDQVKTFIAAVADFVAVSHDGSLSGLLDFLADEENYGVGLERAPERNDDAVQLLTMHKSKGLEWDTVFLPGWAKGVFPGDKLKDNWVKNASQLPASLRLDAEHIAQLDDVSDPGLKLYEEALREEIEASELLLAYVAVTRAGKHLTISYNQSRTTRIGPLAPSWYWTKLTRVPGVHVHESDEIDVAAQPAALVQGWPRTYDQEALARRESAADAVREAQAVHASTGQWPSVALAHRDDADQRAEWDKATELLVAEARQQREGIAHAAHPPFYSATALIALQSEPERYVSQLVRPMPRRPSRASRVGEEFHAWLQRKHGEAATLFEPESQGLPLDLPTSDEKRLAALIEAFERGQFGQRIPCAVEVPFSLVVGGQVVRGRIDAVFEEDGRYLVVDWKTGSAKAANALQLAVYRVAWAEIMNVPVERVDAVFYEVSTDEVVVPEILLDRTDLSQEVERLTKWG